MGVKMVVVSILLVTLAGCLFGPLNARVKILDFEREGDFLKVNYTLKNTGTFTIDYYEVFFQVEYMDGTTKTAFGNGFRALPGQTYACYTYIPVEGKPVKDVKAVKVKLFHYLHLGTPLFVELNLR